MEPTLKMSELRARARKVVEEELVTANAALDHVGDRIVKDMENVVLSELGLEWDSWRRGGWKLKDSYYGSTPLTDAVKVRAGEEAKRIMADVDFSEVHLTDAQLKQVCSRYRAALKEACLLEVEHRAALQADAIVTALLVDIIEDDLSNGEG